MGGSHNSKIGSRDPLVTPNDLIFRILTFWGPGKLSSVSTWLRNGVPVRSGLLSPLYVCLPVCLCVCPHKHFIHDSDHNFCAIFLKSGTWLRHAITKTKFGEQVSRLSAPAYTNRQRFSVFLDNRYSYHHKTSPECQTNRTLHKMVQIGYKRGVA